jgi:hypothetical protein
MDIPDELPGPLTILDVSKTRPAVQDQQLWPRLGLEVMYSQIKNKHL